MNAGQITTKGGFTEYAVPTAGSQPYWIATGPDGSLYFAERSGNKIGKVSL